MGKVYELESAGSKEAVQEAVRVLVSGGVAVFPTDTVYGIAQSVAANPQGPRRVFEIKRRTADKTLPWLVGSLEDLNRYGSRVPCYAQQLAQAFWPGALTLVVDASSEVPAVYRGPNGTVALRLPDSDIACSLVRRVGSALATTSANTSGCPAPVSAQQIEDRICAEADIVLAGAATICGAASTIVICTGPRPVFARIGALSPADILATLK